MTVYVSLIADLLHPGHIRVLKKASELGNVIVGLLTSSAVSELNDKVYLSYDQRAEVVSSLGYVHTVIPQDTASYKDNLLKHRPSFVVHGDDWKTGPQSKYREEVIELLSRWGGSLIEIPYSYDISDNNIKDLLVNLGITKVTRLQQLRRLLKEKRVLHILESHNALSALIAENTCSVRNGNNVSFDGMWSSSLTDSTSKGKPDIEAVDLTSRLNVINEIFEVTTKPLIFDADTGGKIEHFQFTVRSLERIGVSAVVIEDKTGLKKNSLLGNDVIQTQDTIENFSKKISAGKSAQLGPDFMIIARIESLILDQGIEDALARAFAYVEAGADGIMIHSRRKEPSEIFEFVSLFRQTDKVTPIVVVPTSFNTVTIDEFEERGINIVIAANHMLRAAYPAMLNVANSILQYGRTHEIEPLCISIPDILEFVPGTK